jgi:hypothetical protein
MFLLKDGITKGYGNVQSRQMIVTPAHLVALVAIRYRCDYCKSSRAIAHLQVQQPDAESRYLQTGYSELGVAT